MRHFGKRKHLRTAGILMIGILALGASWLTTNNKAHAQIGTGEFWMYQPQQSTPVGRAWCSADHSVEYWAYVVGEYQFSGSSNTSTNRACLNFEFVSTSNYLSLAAFEEDVLGLPEMVGKTIQFQAHVVASETVEN